MFCRACHFEQFFPNIGGRHGSHLAYDYQVVVIMSNILRSHKVNRLNKVKFILFFLKVLISETSGRAKQISLVIMSR